MGYRLFLGTKPIAALRRCLLCGVVTLRTPRQRVALQIELQDRVRRRVDPIRVFRVSCGLKLCSGFRLRCIDVLKLRVQDLLV